VTEGLRLVLGDRLLRGILGPAMVINFLLAPLFGVVLPVFAARAYGEALDLGLLLAGVGAGSVVGSLVYGAIGPGWSRRRTLTLAFLLCGLPFWGLATAPPLPVAVGLLAVFGLLLSPINPLVISVIQRRTPEALLGR
jgi:predicted MFS family arabinose efflux permease